MKRLPWWGRNGAGERPRFKADRRRTFLGPGRQARGSEVTEFSPADRGDVKAAGFSGPGTDRGGDSSGGMPVSAIPLHGNGLNMSRSMTGSLPALMQGLTSTKDRRFFRGEQTKIALIRL